MPAPQKSSIALRVPSFSSGGYVSSTSASWDASSGRLLVATGRNVQLHRVSSLTDVQNSSQFPDPATLNKNRSQRHLQFGPHEDTVVAVGFVNEQRALSVCVDGSIRVWDLELGTCVKTQDVAEQVHDAAFPSRRSEQDEALCVIAGAGTVHLVDIHGLGTVTDDVANNKTDGNGDKAVVEQVMEKQSGKSSTTNPEQAVREQAITMKSLWHDGADRVACDSTCSLIAGVKGKELRVARVFPSKRPRPRHRMVSHMVVSTTHKLTAVAVSEDASLVAVGDARGVISLFRQLGERLHRGPVSRPAIRARASELQCSRFHWHTGPVSALRFAGDDNVLLSGGAEAVLVVWRISRADFGGRDFVSRVGGPIWGISTSPDNSTYALTCADNVVRLVDAYSFDRKRAFHGIRVGVGNQLAGAAAYLDARRRALRQIQPMSLTPAPGNPGTVLVTGTGQSVQVYDVMRREHVGFFPVVPANVIHYGGSKEDDQAQPRIPIVHLVRMCKESLHMVTIDSVPDINPTATSQVKCDTSADVEVMRFWRRNDETKVYDVVSRVQDPHGLCKRVCAIDFHPRLPVVATASKSGTFKLWRAVETGIEKMPWNWRCETAGERKGEPYNCVSFSEDGSMLALGSGNAIELWRVVEALEQSTAMQREGSGENLSEGKHGPRVFEDSPRSLELELVHVLVHPPAGEEVQQIAFLGSMPCFLVGITQNAVYVWHVLGQLIWWSLRLPVAPLHLAVDPGTSRFAIVVNLPGANDPEGEQTPVLNDSHAQGASRRSSKGTAATKAPKARAAAKNKARLPGAEQGAQRSSKRPRDTVGQDDPGTTAREEKQNGDAVMSTEQGDVDDAERGDSNGSGRKADDCTEPGDLRAAPALDAEAQHRGGKARSPQLRGDEALDEKTSAKTGVPSESATGAAGVGDLGNKGSQASAPRRADSAIVVFSASSPMPIMVHRVESPMRVLQMTFVAGSETLAGETVGAGRLTYINSALEVHVVEQPESNENQPGQTVTDQSASPFVAAGIDTGAVHTARDKLGELLGADWRKAVETATVGDGSRGKRKQLSNPASKKRLGLNHEKDAPIGIDMQADPVVSLLDSEFDGSTHTLAPVTLSAPRLINRILRSSLVPTLETSSPSSLHATPHSNGDGCEMADDDSDVRATAAVDAADQMPSNEEPMYDWLRELGDGGIPSDDDRLSSILQSARFFLSSEHAPPSRRVAAKANE